MVYQNFWEDSWHENMISIDLTNENFIERMNLD